MAVSNNHLWFCAGGENRQHPSLESYPGHQIRSQWFCVVTMSKETHKTDSRNKILQSIHPKSFTVPESSMSCSQQHATVNYSEQVESSPYPHTLTPGESTTINVETATNAEDVSDKFNADKSYFKGKTNLQLQAIKSDSTGTRLHDICERGWAR
jgi:hypothetical protein